jgi:Bifunctional DNA primase/polymerase, N-terminal
MRRQATILDIALQYLAQGWMTIPVPYREKNPGFMGWEHCRLDTPAKLAERFNGKAQNIGVLLGEPSNHTIDVDLDFAECLPFGRMFLPSTRQFGREGNPVSHWLYTVPNAPNRTVFASSRITDDGKKIDTVLETWHRSSNRISDIDAQRNRRTDSVGRTATSTQDRFRGSSSVMRTCGGWRCPGALLAARER